MWIQQGREAFQRAFKIVDAFVNKTEGDPEHPWYLPMRLQRDQLCLNIGKGREALAERKRELLEHQDEISLLRYLSMLSDMQDYEAVLSVQKMEGPVGDLIFPPSQKNLSIWWRLIHAAAEMGELDFVEQYMPAVLKVCSGEDEFQFLMCLLDAYEGEHQGEKLAEIKERLISLLPQMSFNKYFEEKAMERIEQ